MNNATLREQIAAYERALLDAYLEQAENGRQSVIIAHRIDGLRTSIEKKRALIRRIENAAIVGRRSADDARRLSRKGRS